MARGMTVQMIESPLSTNLLPRRSKRELPYGLGDLRLSWISQERRNQASGQCRRHAARLCASSLRAAHRHHATKLAALHRIDARGQGEGWRGISS